MINNNVFDLTNAKVEETPEEQFERILAMRNNNERKSRREKNVNRLIRVYNATSDPEAKRALQQKINRLITRYEGDPIT